MRTVGRIGGLLYFATGSWYTFDKNDGPSLVEPEVKPTPATLASYTVAGLSPGCSFSYPLPADTPEKATGGDLSHCHPHGRPR